MLSLSWGGSFGRPWRRRPVGRGATIAVRSVRSGLPHRHPRCRLPAAAFGFPRAHLHAPRPTGRRRHGLQRDHFTGAGANRVLGVLAADRGGTEDLAGPPKPAARAAFFGVWGEGRARCGGIGEAMPAVLRLEESGMHRQASSPSAVLPQIRRAPSPSRASQPPSRAATLFPPTGRHPKQATRHPRAAPTRQAKTPRKLRAAARAATRNGHQQSREVSSLLQRHRPRKT